MPSIAFIVEGNCEQRALQRICPGAKVVTLGLNGRDVASYAMARQVAAVTKVFSNRHFPIVVLFDREQRHEPADYILNEIKTHLEDFGCALDQFIFGIADRKIENWMIPFVNECYPKREATEIIYTEGTSDSGRLKAALRERSINYHKTTVGAQLLCAIKPSELAALSSSFNRFREQLLPYCTWLKY